MITGPSTYAEARALAVRMAQNPADAVAFASKLAELIENLPPPKSELLSRYAFDRASLWTLAASFENVAVGPEAPPQEIRVEHDVWIRGVCAVAIPEIPAAYVNLAYGALLSRQCRFTTNYRQLIELNWRIDARQGFISNGTGEILGPAVLDTGDGEFMAPLDWRLQKDQYIEVRCRSRFDEFQTSDNGSPLNASLRWVVVAFWGEELNMPSLGR